MYRLNLNPTKNQDFFEFYKDARVADLTHLAPKHADLEVFMQYFCQVTGKKWNFFWLCSFTGA